MLSSIVKRYFKDRELRRLLTIRASELVAVVIPVYKTKMNDDEKVAFLQGMEVLKNYPIILVAPYNLCLDAYTSDSPNLQILRFEPYYFDGIAGYNKLTTDYKFYSSFIHYKYILIYQLDCYVFKDELAYWCKQGFDYIGAPWMGKYSQVDLYNQQKQRLTGNDNFIKRQIRKRLATKFDDVGNGGLSLRKVKKFLLILKVFEYSIKKWPSYEDLFYSTVVPNLDITFKLPDKITAMHFAIETEPESCYKMLGENLPFGCHAWKKYSPEFWQKFINKKVEV